MDWLTLALALATVWLGYETKRMASATAETLELGKVPYLEVARITYQRVYVKQTPTGPVEPGLRMRLGLRNPGNVLVNYHVNSITCSLTFPTCDMEKFATKGGVVFPGAETDFKLIHTPFQHPKDGDVAPIGDVAVDITYFSTSAGRRHRLRATMRGVLLPEEFDWHFIEGPSYS